MSDVQAGVRFYFDYEKHQGQIAFAAKPGSQVISFLREQGFDWDREKNAWTVPIRFEQREQDRLAARRAYHKCCDLVRTEKGIQDVSPPLPD